MTEYTCDSFRFFNLFPVYFGGKGTLSRLLKPLFHSQLKGLPNFWIVTV